MSVLWRILSAPQTSLILMGLVVVALLLGTMIPQIPPQAADDPLAWLAAQSGYLGRGSGLIRALGLYDLWHTFGFRLLLALGGLVLFVRSVNAAEVAWRVTAGATWPAASSPLADPHAPQTHLFSPLPVEEARSRLNEYLSREHYRSAHVTGLPLAGLVASRRAAFLWLRALVPAALLLALLGLVILGTWGWQSEVWQLVPGESRPIGHGSPYALHLDAFHMQLGEHGWLVGYQSQLRWLAGETTIGSSVAGIGRPARLGSTGVHQVGYVPILDVQGWDRNGRPLLLQGGNVELGGTQEIQIRFATPTDQPLILVPAYNRVLAIAFEPACGQGRPAIHIDQVDVGQGSRQRLGSLLESGTVPLGDDKLEIELSYVPLLRLDSRPGQGLVVGGIALALLALALAWAVPPRLAWLALVPRDGDTLRLELATLPGARQRTWLSQLAGHLREVLAGDG